MNDSEKLVVCIGKGASMDAAAALAKHVGAPLCDTPGEALTLRIDGDGLSLCGYGMTFHGDFTQMLHRITHGRLPHEMLARLSKTHVPHPIAVDATAGMGEDSLLLAACGYEVTLYEQNPVIAALLQDALHRAKSHPVLRPIVERMHPVEGDSTLWMPKMSDAPTLVYLDPMFPARQKSGQIHKKLQLIQKLFRNRRQILFFQRMEHHHLIQPAHQLRAEICFSLRNGQLFLPFKGSFLPAKPQRCPLPRQLPCAQIGGEQNDAV